jgi:hypothetical protein
MKFKNCLFLMLTLAGVFLCLWIHAQPADSTVRDVEYLKYTNAWLSSGHALGIHALPTSKVSTAEAYAQKSKGRFVNFYESDNHYSAGAKVESYRKMSPKLAFQGTMEYETFRGKNMSGSVFIDPGQYPLDIDEYADSTAGDKKLERYHLAGGVSRKIGERWKIGGKIDYEAANYAKFKDMRHTNKLLQLDGYLGASYAVNNWLELGVGYGYRRRIESIAFGIYGNTDRQYLSLINFGSFYGNAELHDDFGYTGDTNPVYDVVHKASAFANIRLNDQWEWFSEFTYGIRNGYFGKRGTNQIVFTEHAGTQFDYHGVATLKKDVSRHHFDLKLSYHTLDNRQNVYRRETTVGGTSTIVYYGETKVLDQEITQVAFNYTAHLKLSGLTPRWILKAGGNYRNRTQQVSLYPFYRKQEIGQYSLRGYGGRNFMFGNNLLTVSFEAGYGSGGGTAKRDGLYATPSTSQNPPASGDKYLNKEFEYLTASRVVNSIGLRYAHQVEPGQLAYIRLNYINTHAFQVFYLGKSMNAIQLALGYSF